MRWLHVLTLMMYLSVLMASPVHALSHSQADNLVYSVHQDVGLIGQHHQTVVTEVQQSADDPTIKAAEPSIVSSQNYQSFDNRDAAIIEHTYHSHQARAPPVS